MIVSADLTIQDVITAMSSSIVVASSINSRSHEKKSLSFSPLDGDYRVNYLNGKRETRASYSRNELAEAVEFYNSFRI